MIQSGWAVAAIARENPAVIRRFVSWHLALDATEITICFDDPADPASKCLPICPRSDVYAARRASGPVWGSNRPAPL